jgi:hypothetical protein
MSTQRSTRRKFHRDVVVMGAAALATGAKQAAAQEADPLKASGDALCALIEARFGKHLTAEQLVEVKKSVRSDVVARAEFLKRIPLKNSDEPSFVFRADI